MFQVHSFKHIVPRSKIQDPMTTSDQYSNVPKTKALSPFFGLLDDDEYLTHDGSKNKSSQKPRPNTMLNTNTSTNVSTNTEIQTKNWIINNYNISTCYTPNTNIYIHAVSNSTYKNYHKTIVDPDLNSNLTIDLFYILMVKTFDKSTNCSLNWGFDDLTLQLKFSTLLDGFFPLEQHIVLDEKVLSDDGVLTMAITEMEAGFLKEIEGLKTRIDELENRTIIFAFKPDVFGEFFTCKIRDTVLDLTIGDEYCWLGNYMDFNELKSVEQIIMFDEQFCYARNVNDVGSAYPGNKPVPIKAINTWSNGYQSCSYNKWQFQNCLSNIFNTPQIFMPSVTELAIIYKNSSPPTNLNSLPNLRKLSFSKYSNTQLTSFSLIQSIPKLKHLVYSQCLNIHELDKIKNWCDSKNIRLEIN